MSITISPMRDAQGRVIGASKIVRDVTDQRRAQDELETSLRSLETLYRLADLVGQAATRQEVYEAALDALVAGIGGDRASILLFDAEGVMRFTAWRRLSERYRAAMEGHSPWAPDSASPRPIVVSDVQSDPSMAPLRGEIEREGIRALAFIPLVSQRRLVGKFMVYFDQPRALTPRESRLAEIIGRHVSFGLARVDAMNAAADAYVRERSARSEADAARSAAERASQAKDEFLAMLAHELRNPLGVIVHAVQILELSPGLPSDLKRSVSMLERQSKHLASLLDDLLDVARITSGRIELHTSFVDLRDVVSAAVEAQQVRIAAKQQAIQVRLPDHAVPVNGDTVRLQQAVGNLVHNASKYTPDRGSIWVELERDAGEAAIRIRDDGAGIPPERLDAIFDLFVQGSPTLARTEGGLGIGLTLVKRIVEMHDGRVAARSAGAGRGAEFELRMPLASALSATRIPPPAGTLHRPVPDPDPDRRGQRRRTRGARDAAAAEGARGDRGGHGAGRPQGRDRAAALRRVRRHRPAGPRRLRRGRGAARVARRWSPARRADGLRPARRPREGARGRLRRPPGEARHAGADHGDARQGAEGVGGPRAPREARSGPPVSARLRVSARL